ITNSSGEASGPWAVRARPGASAMMRVCSRPRPLVISLLDPLRKTTTESGGAPEVITLRKPTAIESTPTRTATTPATPITAAITDPRRCGMPIRPNFVTEATWENQLRGPEAIWKNLHSTQGVSDSEAHGLKCRQRARGSAQNQRKRQPQDHIAHGQEE